MKVYICLLTSLVACDSAQDIAAEVERRAPPSSASPASAPIQHPEALDLALDPINPPPVDLTVLCQGDTSLVAATCRVHVACRTGADSPSLAACEDHLRAVCEHERPRLEARIANGRLRFDRSALHRCLDTLTTQSCASPQQMQAAATPCDEVLVGRVTRGAACEDAGDCAPGLECMTPDGSCPGQCLPPHELGAWCNAELEPCAPGLSCEAGRCAPARVALGAACVTSAQCGPAAFCLDPEAGGVCAPKVGNGKPCDDEDTCESGFCLVDILSDALDVDRGICATPLPAGASCEPLVGGCASGLTCDEASSRCVASDPDVGGTCLESASPCGPGLRCDQGLCELEPFVGDACDPAIPGTCGFGHCAPTDASGIGQCQPFLAPLSACENDSQCGALACIQGRCDRPPTRCGASLSDINLGASYRIR